MLKLLAARLFFADLLLVSLADASALILIYSLVVTAPAMSVLREPMSQRHWVVVIIGMLGTAGMMRPDSEFMSMGILCPSPRIILTRLTKLALPFCDTLILHTQQCFTLLW